MKVIDVEQLNSADINHAVLIAPRIWWVGHYMPDDIFQCHAYLIEHGENSVLIDPGGSESFFKQVREKVEEVIPLSHVRYIVCHHQDPDITGSLITIDKLKDRSPELKIVTHWRAVELIKHYDLTMPFLNVEENNWQLDLGGRVLKFVFTPYLHFPGAFCTFDEQTGVLFSSDIFGGMTEDWSLVAKDVSYFEDIRPFHEHYMPSNAILLHGLLKLEELPIEMIAPQHGSIIPSHLVQFMFNKLKQIDCGIYALTGDDTDIRLLSSLNKALRDITDAVIVYRDFKDIVSSLMEIFARLVPVSSMEFFVQADDNTLIHFERQSNYHGEIVDSAPAYCADVFGVDRNAWILKNSLGCKKILLPSDPASEEREEVNILLMPLCSHDNHIIKAVAVVRLECDIEVTFPVEKILGQMEYALAVAVERESIYRMLDLERKKLYQQSIHDPLTGLYNRFFMEESVNRLMHIHDRNDQNRIGLIMVDIDYFKNINDTYGHGVGDTVLKEITATIGRCVRSGDIAVRYGGEEFALFVVGYNKEECSKLGTRVMEQVSAMTFDDLPDNEKITISVGVALREQKEKLKDFIYRADKALYEAKSGGRNRICFAKNPQDGA